MYQVVRLYCSHRSNLHFIVQPLLEGSTEGLKCYSELMAHQDLIARVEVLSKYVRYESAEGKKDRVVSLWLSSLVL